MGRCAPGFTPLAAESPALAGLSRAAILGRAALGPRVGRGPERIGADPDAPWVDRRVPLHAHDGGFDLHAAVHVEAGDRARLERLCQYLCRPPLGHGRLRTLCDGRIAVVLQRPWADGTTHLVFTPLELLQRLVPLVPRPRINLLLYHGVLAPNAPLRREVVARAEPEDAAVDPPPPAPPADEEAGEATPHRPRPRYRAWADLMRRAFQADVLACPRCGGRMTVLATIEDPAVIHRILTHLGLSTEAGEAMPAARGSP
jgi:Putative transposase